MGVKRGLWCWRKCLNYNYLKHCAYDNFQTKIIKRVTSFILCNEKSKFYTELLVLLGGWACNYDKDTVYNL
jgi:hypothetical protein